MLVSNNIWLHACSWTAAVICWSIQAAEGAALEWCCTQAFAWTRCSCQRSISWLESQGAGWAEPFPWAWNPLLSIARASSCSCAGGNYIQKKIFCVLRREERACSLGSERLFHLALTCRKKNKGNNFAKYSLKCFRLECVSRTPGSTIETANAAQSLLHLCSACSPLGPAMAHPFLSILERISALFTVLVPRSWNIVWFQRKLLR